VFAPWSVQSPSGSVPLGTLLHTPLVPPVLAALHAWHVPSHALSQQKPSTQLPLMHCDDDVQALPLAWSGWQLLSLVRHQDVATQPPSLAQLVPHAEPLHTYGSHDVTLLGLQMPKPSQE
jgi:hypothetical protein